MERPKRKQFWIDPPLQLRILGFVLALVAGSLALVYLSMDRGLEQAARDTQRVFIPVEWARDTLTAPFLFSSAVVLTAGAVLTLLWSHRMIGPLMVLTAALRRVRDGDLVTELTVRGSDSLSETIRDFDAMQQALREKLAEDRERLARIGSRLEALAAKLRSEETRHELDAIRGELRQVTSFFKI